MHFGTSNQLHLLPFSDYGEGEFLIRVQWARIFLFIPSGDEVAGTQRIKNEKFSLMP